MYVCIRPAPGPAVVRDQPPAEVVVKERVAVPEPARVVIKEIE